jgi:uncharacterized protein YbdZ (MbtH family)
MRHYVTGGLMPEEIEDRVIYRVVVNHEEQYSIWPADRDIPAGWRDEGTAGLKAECLTHIDEVWTDMRPLSLRKHMAEMEREAPVTDGNDTELGEPDEPEESLVSRLSSGDHMVELSLRPERTTQALREAVERGYVLVRFTQTRGGTELGVRLDHGASDTAGADFDAQQGHVHLEGDLILDFEPVRCMADIDLATMAGYGRLSAAEASGDRR